MDGEEARVLEIYAAHCDPSTWATQNNYIQRIQFNK